MNLSRTATATLFSLMCLTFSCDKQERALNPINSNKKHSAARPYPGTGLESWGGITLSPHTVCSSTNPDGNCNYTIDYYYGHWAAMPIQISAWSMTYRADRIIEGDLVCGTISNELDLINSSISVEQHPECTHSGVFVINRSEVGGQSG